MEIQAVPLPSPSPSRDEPGLIAGLRLGDEVAYQRLIDRHRARMLAIARRYLDEEDARDAVQDAFVAVLRAIDRFEGKATLSTWLHRVVVNACLMKLRSRRRKPEHPLPPTLDQRLTASPHENPDRSLEDAECDAWVQQALHELPEPHRTVIELRDIQQRDTRETAALLNLTPGAVKTRLHRARALLRTQLQRDPSGCAECVGPHPARDPFGRTTGSTSGAPPGG